MSLALFQSNPTGPANGEPLRPRTSADPSWNAPLFPTAYVWLIFLSAMDCLMTWMVLYFGGEELNHIANTILERFDMAGMVAYKFILITFVIFCCELVGRRRPRTGLRLVTAAVALSTVPVTFAFAQFLATPL